MTYACNSSTEVEEIRLEVQGQPGIHEMTPFKGQRESKLYSRTVAGAHPYLFSQTICFSTSKKHCIRVLDRHQETSFKKSSTAFTSS